MHPVVTHTFNLPNSFIVYENEDEVRVDCLRCAHEAVYSAHGVDPVAVAADAWGHLTVCRRDGPYLAGDV